MAAAVALPLALGVARSWASEPAGDVAYGEYLSTECVTCHRPTGATSGGIPPIVGLSPSAFVDALLAYKDGQRDNQVMRNVTSVLGAEEIAALAAYFATLSPD
jgi:cytochrome c